MRRLLMMLVFSAVLLMSFSQELEARISKKRLPSRGKKTAVLYDKDGSLILNNPADVGFGALVFSIFAVLNEFEKGSMAGVKVNFNSGCYLDEDLGPNWWEYFFEPLALGNTDAPPFYLDESQAILAANVGYGIPRYRTSELAKRYIVLKPDLQEEIDDYLNRNFDGHYVIGVHHRGTDKKTEVPIIPYERTLKFLSKRIAKLSAAERNQLRIYVATDDQNFLDRILQSYPSQVIYNDFVRSKDGQPLHYSQDLYGSNYQKGKETIIDCFLLSRCNLLIYPACSSYSSLSAALNSDLQVVPVRWLR